MSGSRPGISILRTLRLQLKSGYLRHEPVEYDYLRRFPPLPSHSTPKHHVINTVNVPYVDLFEKALDKNQLFERDRIYPAFSHQEPLGLVLAKRQYLYMQQGMSESDAYDKAMKYIDELEDLAYAEMKDITVKIKDMGSVHDAVLGDENIRKKLAEWQAKLQDIAYEDLSLAEQGELDYFIQIHLLKWNEVERSRRMQDPVFFIQFEKLLTSLFPLSETSKLKTRQKFKKNFLRFNRYNERKITALKPFYLEDYLMYWNKAMQNPDLQNW